MENMIKFLSLHDYAFCVEDESTVCVRIAYVMNGNLGFDVFKARNMRQLRKVLGY